MTICEGDVYDYLPGSGMNSFSIRILKIEGEFVDLKWGSSLTPTRCTRRALELLAERRTSAGTLRLSLSSRGVPK